MALDHERMPGLGADRFLELEGTCVTDLDYDGTFNRITLLVELVLPVPRKNSIAAIPSRTALRSR